jgi:geranylgeranyl pyrophosphate synthase
VTEAAAARARDDHGDAFDRLLGLVEDDMARVNAEIAERMRSEHTDLIPQISAHLIGAGGKRLRPILTLAAAKLCGYDGRRACEARRGGGVHPQRHAAP